MKNILLTGANGFLGSHLLEALLEQGFQVSILKRSTSDTWRIKHLLADVKAYDVDTAALAEPFKDRHIEAVIHTACHYGRKGQLVNEVVETNLLFGLRLLDAAVSFNVGTFVNTDTLLQKHLNVYSLSKKQFVEWLQQRSDQIQVINLKLEHMYGPKDDTAKFIPWVLSQLQAKAPEIKLTEGIQQRDFVYIDDVVAAYLTVLKKASSLAGFSELDVGTGKLITVKKFLETLKAVYEADVEPIPTNLAFGALPYREGEAMTVEVDNQPLLDLGWSPKTELIAGIDEIIKGYR